MIAKICTAASRAYAYNRGRTGPVRSFFVRGNMKPEVGAIP